MKYLKVIHASGARIAGYGNKPKGGIFALPDEIGEQFLERRKNTFVEVSEGDYNRANNLVVEPVETPAVEVGKASKTDDTEPKPSQSTRRKTEDK